MNKCPKCHQDVRPLQEICTHCGIVFAKYFLYHGNSLPQRETLHTRFSIDEQTSLFQRVIEDDVYRLNHLAFWGRCLLLPLFIIWSWVLITPSIASNEVAASFLHNVNLPFHEAGHIFFGPFGAFIKSLGGTLGQLLMPAICMLVLWVKTRDPYGAGLALWWVGENFLDISPYINDARAGQIPLLGGNTGEFSPYGFHDWTFLLTESGFLQYDHLLAKFSHVTGSLIMLAALLGCAYLLMKQKKVLANSTIDFEGHP
jgi:hypothetical protein